MKGIIENIFKGKKKAVIDQNQEDVDVIEEIKDWKNIDLEFTPELQKEWEKKGFSYKECEEWIDAGLKVSDASYAYWLWNIKKKDAEWLWIENDEKLRKEYEDEKFSTFEEGEIGQITRKATIGRLHHSNAIISKRRVSRLYISNAGLDDYDDFFVAKNSIRPNKKYELCPECYKWNSWCQPCNTKHFQENFKNWTSGNQVIDKFIQKSQLKATNHREILEWIPYEKFTDIEHVADGGFGKVYKAKWVDGEVKSWSVKDNNWKRDKKYSEDIVLKSLNNSRDITARFLQEITHHTLFNNSDYTDLVVKCYGISQDPGTGDYLMIMEYVEGGNLRQYLQNNYNELPLTDKLHQLYYITEGLKNIHKQGLIHRDFHSGNILKSTKLKNGYDNCYITDLGLCRPANEENQEKIYGVLPYVAPEVLLEKKYTQKADVYSWGMVAYELFTGLSPYHECTHDLNLALKICAGLRPRFNIKLPQLLEDLIKQCWDADPLQRPTTSELSNNLWKWWREIVYKKDTKFYRQYKEIEENKELPKSTIHSSYKNYPRAKLTSQLLDFPNLPSPQNNKEINEEIWGSHDLSLNIENIGTQLQETSLKEQSEQSTQAQIQIPPK